MEEIDFTTALGRVLSSARLRREFLEAPEKVAAALNVAAAERPAFCALDAAALQQQADALIAKRCHEVLALLPRTAQLHGENAAALFTEYAETYWPAGAARHPADALAFAEYLHDNGHATFAPEVNILALALSKKRSMWKLPRIIWPDGRTAHGIQILRKTRHGIKSRLFYVRL